MLKSTSQAELAHLRSMRLYWAHTGPHLEKPSRDNRRSTLETGGHHSTKKASPWAKYAVRLIECLPAFDALATQSKHEGAHL